MDLKTPATFHIPFIHPRYAAITIPTATLSAILEQYLGLKALTAVSFILLLSLELITGIVVSVFIKKKRIRSNKFSRFGFKILVWMLLFFIVHSFKMQWKEESTVVYTLFDWLYNVIIIYVSLEYLISVLENLGAISGKSNMKLIRSLRKKLNKLLDLDGEDEQPIQ